jgi:hypothetical protein
MKSTFPVPHRNRHPRKFLAVRRLVLSGTLSSALFNPSAVTAEMSELRVQGRWAYAYRIDQRNEIEFMATTPAIEDNNIWLMLACKESQRITLSLVNSSGFAYDLAEQVLLILQLDGSTDISLPSVVIRQRQIRADPAATKNLMHVFMRSTHLSISTVDIDGTPHAYSFSLQPNNLALRDIDHHCLFE